MEEDLGRSVHGHDADVRMSAPVPKLLEILIVEHGEAVLAVVEFVAANDAQALEEIEGYQREAANDLQIAVYLLDHAQTILEFLHDVLAAAYLYFQAAANVSASAKLLRRGDAVDVRTGTILQTRALALPTGHTVVLLALHVTGRTLDHAAAVERFVRIILDSVQCLARLRHAAAFLFTDAAPVHKLVGAFRATILALVAVDHTLANDTVSGCQSGASTQAGTMAASPRVVAGAVLGASPIAYYIIKRDLFCLKIPLDSPWEIRR